MVLVRELVRQAATANCTVVTILGRLIPSLRSVAPAGLIGRIYLKNTENKQKLRTLKVVMTARSSSQCSGSSAGASAAGGKC